MSKLEMSFEKLLHTYQNPPMNGDVIRIPDFIFTHNAWGFLKLENAVSKNPASTNTLILKHQDQEGAGVMMAVHIPVITFWGNDGVIIERDITKQDTLSLPCLDKGFNKNLFAQEKLLIGTQVLSACNKVNHDSVVPVKVFDLGYNNPLVSAIIANLGGLPVISEDINKFLSC